MNKKLILSLALFFPLSSIAQPTIVELLKLNESIVHVSVDLGKGNTGTGTGVVVSKEYVATNCHILANAYGANIAKYGDGYQPIGMKADWKHDLCLLKFDKLPFKPVPMRDSATLLNEEEVFTIGFPSGNSVPQPSYGSIKATYPLDNSLIIRSNAAFALGSSGGAMFDQQFNLIGITSFKNPGPNSFFYSMPVEWIKQLFDAPELISLKTEEQPFWALPNTQHPFFMKVVVPFQNREWDEVKKIAGEWVLREPTLADAWYFLGVAELESKQIAEAKLHLNKTTALDSRHLEALLKLSEIAVSENNYAELDKVISLIQPIDAVEAEQLSLKIATLKKE
jgi:hypothetical protein